MKFMILLTSANFFLVGDFGVEIAPVGVIHHNAQASLVHKALFVSDDIWMSHSFEHVNLNISCGWSNRCMKFSLDERLCLSIFLDLTLLILPH